MPTRYSVDISFDKTNINKELMKVRIYLRMRNIVQLTCKSVDHTRVPQCGIMVCSVPVLWRRTKIILVLGISCCVLQVFHDLPVTHAASIETQIKPRASALILLLLFFSSGSHEEKEGSQHGPHQVRGEIQVRQEQMVLPEAEVLDLTNCLYCRDLYPLSTKFKTHGSLYFRS